MIYDGNFFLTLKVSEMHISITVRVVSFMSLFSIQGRVRPVINIISKIWQFDKSKKNSRKGIYSYICNIHVYEIFSLYGMFLDLKKIKILACP